MDLDSKFAIFGCVLLFLDIVTKFLFKGSSFSSINTGSLFGLFFGNNLFFIILTIILLSIVFVWFFKYPELKLGFSLILVGGFGNLIDRILYSGVVDFIYTGFWPTFNLADVYVVIGILICIFVILKKK